MFSLINRNIRIFFRDRAAVFFSLLSVFIMVGVYVLFLGNSFKKSLNVNHIDFLMNSWIMAGMITVTSVTSSLGAFGVMVEDNKKNILKDFYSTPLKRWKIVAGYILSSCIVGIMMTIINFILAEIFIYSSGGEILNVKKIAFVLGIIILTVISNSAMAFFIISFFKSQNAFSTACTIIGTLIGFLLGVYIPIGEFPNYVQKIIKIFPPNYAASLLRKFFLEKPMDLAFAGAQINAIKDFKSTMGVDIVINGSEVSILASVAFLIIAAFVFYILSIMNIRRKRKS